MSLRRSFRLSAKAVAQWPAGSRPMLAHLCRGIREAEGGLNAAAANRLAACHGECRGMCCRNLQLDAVFGVPDFIYILTLAPEMIVKIEECLRHEVSFFTADCFFLEGGVGPCIFPSDLRPEVCITSFCRGDESIRAEIRRVKTEFWKLGVLLHLRRLPFWKNLCAVHQMPIE